MVQHDVSACEINDVFELDGELWEVRSIEGNEIMNAQFGPNSSEEEWEVGEAEDINKMVWDQGAEGTKEDTVEHSPDPDIRLVRNI
jgi:hypothetical protein